MAVDLRAFELAAVAVSAEELTAHQAVLAELDKASGGRTLWHHLA
jgi:DNA polymerase-3 subunit epsilon